MFHISTKWRLFLFLCGTATAGCLREPRYDSTILAAMDRMFRMEYAAAESLLVRIPENAAAKPYFAGIVRLNRFQDLGDTIALRHAESFWTRLDSDRPDAFRKEDPSRLETYQGLALMQLSYVAALRGSRLRSASLALAAQGHLSRWPDMVEARAGTALFDYYRRRFLSAIPFVHPDLELPLRQLQNAADSSRYLSDVLRFSLFWMRIDRKEIDSALRISDSFLKRYPGNRLARQMRGSALFRAGKLAEARAIYEDLLREYAGLKDPSAHGIPPLGYTRSVGNLARIYSGLGLKAEAGAKLAEWQKALESGLSPWLPASLKRDLASLKNP